MQAQCLQLVQQAVWDGKQEVDGGDRGNTLFDNWQRNGNRVPGECSEEGLSLDEEMPDV